MHLDTHYGMRWIRTRLSKSTALITARPNVQLLRPSRIHVLLHRPSRTSTQSFQPRTQRTLSRWYALEPFPLSAAQLHDLVLQPLLALIPCPLDRPACRLITAADPACDASFWRIAPYVRIDGCEEGIVCVFEGGCSEDLGQLVRELFLVEVAKHEEGERFFVDCPVGVAYGALHCRIQGLNVYAGAPRCAGFLAEVRLQGGQVGQRARGEGRRRRHVHFIWPHGSRHDGCRDAPWWRSMRCDVRVASWARSGTDARADGGEGRRDAPYGDWHDYALV